MNLSDLNILDVGINIQMVGAIYNSRKEGEFYLCFFPGEEHEAQPGIFSAVFLEMDLTDWHTFLRQTDLLETEVWVKEPDGKVRKSILRKSQRLIDQRVSWTVYRRDGYACRYCGNDRVPLTVDHLVLWEDGGPSTVENLVAACKKCNKIRGNTQYEDWLVHPYYKKVSKTLDPGIRQENQDLLPTLDAIPRVAVRSR